MADARSCVIGVLPAAAYDFGRPLGICKITTVGVAMQTRPQTASLIAYKFDEFHPCLLELSLTARSHFPPKVNRAHDILRARGRTLLVASG